MTTVILQPDSSVDYDTLLISSSATSNFYTLDHIHVGESSAASSVHRTVTKFDLSSIPAMAKCDSAILELTVKVDDTTNARTQRVYRLLKSYVAAEATWNKRDAATDWITAGGFDPADCEQLDIGSSDISATVALGDKYTFNLSPAAIQSLWTGTFTNNGFLIKADTESNDMVQWCSCNHATSGYRPKLTIVYHLGGGKPIFANFGVA